MPLYAYRCDADGPVEVMAPMGAATPTVPCPTCGAGAVRVITAPRLGGARRDLVAAIDRAEASRTEPAVVSAPPPRPAARPAPRLDPRTASLPRP
ncbi:FmdB family zinc ribbon protein [Actinomycetospora soli]|uniref:FmdB family zinc ribbon protein n=1 Tax=Actinomycetospora soli TaxID=2893887 RepID=UPI001E60BBB6|nr:FmdB family zinc ribbon protein [Actinomycetospora soli]MCD2185863.1 zinc ribbon domain-containing protein [Actinomycetospora soli]